MWRAVIVGLLSVAPLSSAFAWGDEGHRIVCGIAYKEATDQTRARIDALIATDGTFTSFADSCTWPDHPRQRAEEHYVDLLRYSGSLPDDTCPLADRCVVSAIETEVGRLQMPAATASAHLEALKFLGHWVGDVHQPLHVSFDDDRGANSVKVSGQCSGTLHGAWDTCLVALAVGADPAAAADQLEQEITAADRADWITSGPVAWANESFAIATAPATGYCIEDNGVCRYSVTSVALAPDSPEKTVTVDAAYVAMSTPIVRDRLKRAGARLAHLLDETLGE